MNWTAEDARIIQTQYALWHSQPESAFGWWDQESQEDYADDLLALCGLQHARVLDLGCGDGVLFERAEQFGFAWEHYTGVDHNDDFLKIAQKKFAAFKNRVEFQRGDALALHVTPPSPVDFIMASGLFAIRPGRWSTAQFNDLILQFVQHYAALARRGVIFNVCPQDAKTQSDIDQSVYIGTASHFVDCKALTARLAEAGYGVRLLPAEPYHLNEQFPLLVTNPSQ